MVTGWAGSGTSTWTRETANQAGPSSPSAACVPSGCSSHWSRRPQPANRCRCRCRRRRCAPRRESAPPLSCPRTTRPGSPPTTAVSGPTCPGAAAARAGHLLLESVGPNPRADPPAPGSSARPGGRRSRACLDPEPVSPPLWPRRGPFAGVAAARGGRGWRRHWTAVRASRVCTACAAGSPLACDEQDRSRRSGLRCRSSRPDHTGGGHRRWQAD
jgi:hypothetical protein